MHFLRLPMSVAAICSVVLTHAAVGAVVFKAGEKAKYVAPGDEEMSGNAEELFQKAQQAEKDNNLTRAIRAYRTLVKKHPRDVLAPGALFRMAELQEKIGKYQPAAESFRALVAAYPSNPHFDEAIEAQFRIGEMYLSKNKLRLLGIPVASALDRAVDIFAAVVRTAPYGKYTARAQFDIGLAREKQGANDAALQAYQAVVDKFPKEPVAADAQYQIGYIWFNSARTGTKDIAATKNATTAFQDFLFRYPHSEKAAQARANLQLLQQKQTVSSFQVAKFYDKQKNYRAAVIYYNEVIREQPGSEESERAKKRIDQLRAKFGEQALQPRFATAEAAAAEEKKKTAHESHSDRQPSGEPAGASSTVGGSPLPPSESDAALPPPASLLPDTTTAPSSPDTTSPGGASSSSSSEPSSAPTASESPTP